MLIVGCAAGAPFLLKLVQLAGGSVAFAGSMLVLLLPLTVVYMPIVLPLLIPGGVDVDALEIAQPLVLTMLLPLALGLLVHAQWPRVGAAVKPALGPISNISLLLLLILIVINTWESLIEVFGERLLLAGILFVVGSFILGYLSSSGEYRSETGFTTGQRNMAAANVVAINSVGQADVIVGVAIVSFMSMVVLFPLATAFSRRRSGETADAPT